MIFILLKCVDQDKIYQHIHRRNGYDGKIQNVKELHYKYIHNLPNWRRKNLRDVQLLQQNLNNDLIYTHAHLYTICAERKNTRLVATHFEFIRVHHSYISSNHLLITNVNSKLHLSVVIQNEMICECCTLCIKIVCF